MKALKKVLALALVFALALTMMAGATPFKDDDKITMKDQVDLVYALNIMQGFPSGNFEPAKTITRAQAAKMIYVMRVGKDAGSENYVDVVKPFSDTKGHWAEGYINYAYMNGIIAGYASGVFKPEGEVTGVQLAKMVLGVIGYGDKAQLTGENWLVNTMSLAFECGLFEDYKTDVSLPAPREDAATLFYNAIFTNTVNWRDDEYQKVNALGLDNPTVGEKYFGLKKASGTLLAAEGTGIVPGSFDDDQLRIVDGDGNITDFTFDSGKDLLGEGVDVFYKEDGNGDIKVYNVVSNGDSKTYKTTFGDIEEGSQENQIKVNGKKLIVEDATGIINGELIERPLTAGMLLVKTNTEVKLVDADGDGEIDLVVADVKFIDYVSMKDEDGIELDGLGYFKWENDDGDKQVFADGIEEKDYVWALPDYNKETITLTKATGEEGKVTGVQLTDGMGKLRIGSTFYETGDLYAWAYFQEIGDIEYPAINDEITFYTDGKYIVGTVIKVEESKDYGFLTTTKAEQEDVFDGSDAKAQFIDKEGKDAIYTVAKNKIDGSKVEGDEYGLYAYAIKDGELKLTIPDGWDYANDVDYVANTKTFDGIVIAADAQIYYMTDWGDGVDDIKMIKRSALGDDDFEAEYAEYIVKGGKIVALAFASDADTIDAGTSDEIFGYITADPVLTINDDDDEVVEYTIWANGKSMSLKDNLSDTEDDVLPKGVFVLFKVSANDETAIKEMAPAAGIVTRVDDYDSGDNIVQMDGDWFAFDGDAQILYVDNDKVEGRASATIRKPSSGADPDKGNAFYILNDKGDKILYFGFDTSCTLPMGSPT